MEEKSFGARLAEYRKAHFLTQHEMGELLGVSTNHIGVLEREIKQPRASTEAAFARLTRRREIPSFGDSRPMTEEEIETYNRLWESLNEMSPEQRKEVMSVFRKILEWL